MITVKAIENIDQIQCQRHNGSIELFSLEENGKVLDQLLCVDCIREKPKVYSALPWNDVIRMIQEDQQKNANEFEQSMQPMIEQVQALQVIIEKVKTSLFDKLSQVVAVISNWAKEISELLCNVHTYSLVKELENMMDKQKASKQYSFENKNQEAITKCNSQYLKKLQDKFKQIRLSEQMVELSTIIQNLFSLMKGNLLGGNLNQAQATTVQQKTSAIKCICPQHETLITMINVNKGIKKENRTICVNCDISNAISTSKFEERWKLYQGLLQNMRNDKLSKLQLDVAQTKTQIKQMKSQFIMDFNQIEILLDTSIKNRTILVNKQQVKENYSNNLEQLQQIAEELSQNENSKELIDDREFDNMFQLTNQQLILLFDKLKISFNGTIEDLKIATECKLNTAQKQLDQQKLKPITYQLVDEIYQEQHCLAVAFNNNGSIMVATCDNQIKIWQLENGKLKSTANILSGHTDYVWCLVFSKKMNWFASGGNDNMIRCWKEIKQNNWVSSQPGTLHTSNIYCLLLTRNEDQLLSCSSDKSIKVWKVDCNNNLLTYDYSLDKHTEWVGCISLNEQETSLVSCGGDISIIIWGKGQLNKWEFKSYITKSTDDYGYRITFMSDNMIAWQQSSQGITHIFQLDNGVFKERPELKILPNQVGEDVYCLFPSVYNKKRNVLIQKHNKFVYIIRKQNDDQFIVDLQPIYCNSDYNYGGLTECGQNLVIWNDGTKQLRLYRINYE